MKIETRYISATSTEGDRIEVVHENGVRVKVPYPQGVIGVNAHQKVAEEVSDSAVEQVRANMLGYVWETK